MNRKIKKLWMDALVSGKYEQGKSKLRIRGSKGDKFCCLGVLSDLYCKANPDSTKREVFGEKNKESLLVDVVQDWAELDINDPECGKFSLSEHNDGHGSVCKPKTFAQIRNLIRKYL